VNWVPFYAAMVGAAVAVMGLLFVAVQLSADRLPADVRRGWESVASCTFHIFLTVFFLPLWILIPAFDAHGRSLIVLIVSVIGVWRVVRASLPICNGALRIGGNRWWQMLWYSVAPLVLYALMVSEVAGAYLGQWQQSTDEHIAILLTVLFSLGLKNSWNLFTEVAFQARDSKGRVR